MRRLQHNLCLAIGFLAVLLGAGPEVARAEPIETIVQRVENEATRTGAEFQSLKAGIDAERRELTAQVEAFRASTQTREAELEALKQSFEELLTRETEARGQLAGELEQAQLVEGTVRGAARDVDALLQQSVYSALHPELREQMLPLLDPERYPAFEDMETLSELLYTLMQTSGEVEIAPGRYVDGDGKGNEAEILRVGEWSAYYRDGDDRGFLQLNQENRSLTAVNGGGWLLLRSLDRYFEGKSDTLPVDLSGGGALSQLSQHRGFKHWLRAGGFLVWPILLVGVVAVLLILERIITLSRVRANADRVMERIRELLSKGERNECVEYCASHRKAPVCRVLENGLKYWNRSREVLESALEDAMLKEIPRLERFLPTLSVLAAIAPLLGLLGTVTGMINTFRVITLFGTGDPRLMSGGISEALITTQLGLAVAIPVMIAHHFLDRRVERIVGVMEEKAVDLTVLLQRKEPTIGGGEPVHHVA